MGKDDIYREIEELDDAISRLPKGTVTHKTVNGRKYYYHQYTSGGKRVERSLGPDPARAEAMRADIERRKELERSRDALGAGFFYKAPGDVPSAGRAFNTKVLTGARLKEFASVASGYKRRECFGALHEYLYGGERNRVFILYGLRRTGKTTLIRQAVLDMDEGDFEKAAYIGISEKDTMILLNKDLDLLMDMGYRYVFIDEVTYLDDFIDCASILSDIYVPCGMKIVLSGTDSLGFLLSSYNKLYDRCRMVHTTFIPYREFESVLGVKGIDEYIRRGGTMTVSGERYNDGEAFDDSGATNEYVDSAIAHNIQHSLEHFQYGNYFRHLQELYDKDELTSAINRVVEDMNHRFTVEVLTSEFKSNDLALSARNLYYDRNERDAILYEVDTAAVTERLKTCLDILNEDEQTVRVSDVYADEIKEYLRRLDLVYDIDLYTVPRTNEKKFQTVISQPGLRYSQVTALVDSVMRDERFDDCPVDEIEKVKSRIYSCVSGRMMEETVLLETALAKPKSRVFKLRFDVGEFDMVVQDPASLTCEIYEIKYSRVTDPGQTRFLRNEDMCEKTVFRYGRITGKYVIYRGETTDVGDVRYLNVEEYLKGL